VSERKPTLKLVWRPDGWYFEGKPVYVKVEMPQYNPENETDREIMTFLKKYDLLEGIEVKPEVIPETKVPEGVTVVKFEMETPEFAEVLEECFKKFMEGFAGRSAVGYDHKVRFVMVHRDKPKVGYPIEVVCKDKENSIALRQTVDWVYTGEIEVVAVRRQEKAVEVAYIRKGIAKPKREPMIYTFKKTDGWSLVGEPKR
jgi:hypothetical protein